MKKKIIMCAALAFMLAACGTSQPSTSAGGVTTSNSTSTVAPTTSTPKTALEIFLAAKDAVYESRTYEYTYEIEAKIKFKGAPSFSPANISGTVQYDRDGEESQFVSKRELSGLLLIDSTSYTYNVGTDLIKLNADETKDFSIVNHEKIDKGYDFESNSIGILLKQLDNSGNLSVKKDGDRYNLSLKTNFAEDSFLKALNHIDSQKILTALNKITRAKWKVGFAVECYATVANDKVKTFHFGASVNVKDVVEVAFAFDQTFTSFGGDITLQLPKFENTFITASDIDRELVSLNEAFDVNKENYYKYDLKTAVDHGVSQGNPLGLAVNSHSQGYAERSKLGDEIYFHNGLELDSDYKNKDQYPDICDDYKFTRAKVNNNDNEVYDVKDGIIKNTYNLIEDYDNDEIDDYYMLINKEWLSSSTIKIMRKTTDKDNNVIYKLGLGEEGVRNILSYYNGHIRLSSDPKKDHIDVYKIYSGLNTKKADFEVTLDNTNKITSIDLFLKGFYNMSEDDDVKFNLELKIRFDYSKETYEIPTDKKDIKLPNYDVIG